jgi:hypothetical protein
MPSASVARRLAGSQNISSPPMQRRSRWLFFTIVIVLAVGLAAVWTFVAKQQLQQSIVAETADHLTGARKAFDTLRAQTQASLQSHCRVLVEDPRLKSTLATEGMDAATVADILSDLGKLRGAGFLMVLTPEGRVFAQSGAPELEGLDLADSSIVKKAQGTNEAVVGSWVLAGKVMDLSIMTIRYGEQIIAFLAVGQPVDDKLLRAVSDQTGVAAASALGNKVVYSSSTDRDVGAVFASAVGETGGVMNRVMSSEGRRYVVAVVELAETAQAHRLVLVGSLDTANKRFEMVQWLIFVPPLLVLLAVLFSMTGSRSPRRMA